VLVAIDAHPKPQLCLPMRKKSNNRVVIDDEKLEVSSEYLRALAHPLRMRILAFIDRHTAVNVNKIYNTLQLEQSITSQHLKILREVGIVETERDGKYILYKVAYDKLGESINAIRNFVENLDDTDDFEDYD
jgi:ArsR family transcriptional regulator